MRSKPQWRGKCYGSKLMEDRMTEHVTTRLDADEQQLAVGAVIETPGRTLAALAIGDRHAE